MEETHSKEASAALFSPERRRLLEGLALHGSHWQTSAVSDDGEALFSVAEERGLEGVVAKRWRSSYRPGERSWVKVKNRNYWRYELEREAAIRERARRGRGSVSCSRGNAGIEAAMR